MNHYTNEIHSQTKKRHQFAIIFRQRLTGNTGEQPLNDRGTFIHKTS